MLKIHKLQGEQRRHNFSISVIILEQILNTFSHQKQPPTIHFKNMRNLQENCCFEWFHHKCRIIMNPFHNFIYSPRIVNTINELELLGNLN